MVDPSESSESPRGLGGMCFNVAGIPSELCAFLRQQQDATATTTTRRKRSQRERAAVHTGRRGGGHCPEFSALDLMPRCDANAAARLVRSFLFQEPLLPPPSHAGSS